MPLTNVSFHLARVWCTIQSTCRLRMNRDSKRKINEKRARSSALVPVTLLRKQQELKWWPRMSAWIRWHSPRFHINVLQKRSTVDLIFWPMTSFKEDLLRLRQLLTWSRLQEHGIRSALLQVKMSTWTQTLHKVKIISTWTSKLAISREDHADWILISHALALK